MHIAGESANTIASALGASRATVYVSWPRTELAATFRSDTARPNPPRTMPRECLGDSFDARQIRGKPFSSRCTAIACRGTYSAMVNPTTSAAPCMSVITR